MTHTYTSFALTAMEHKGHRYENFRNFGENQSLLQIITTRRLNDILRHFFSREKRIYRYVDLCARAGAGRLFLAAGRLARD